MVERLKRSLLQFLRLYVEQEHYWDKHLPLALFSYGHTNDTSPFILMFGRQPGLSDFSFCSGM